MTFKGFPSETVDFLCDLNRNNNRAWFTKHKKRYKDQVESPAREFLEDLTPRLSDLVGHPLGGKLFRIYRDVRFSKDKTPYNAHVRMLFHPFDVESTCGDKPVFCFSLEPDSIISGTGTGSMEFSKSTLESFRDAVDKEKTGKSLTTLLKKYTPAEGFRIDPPALKRVPPDYPKDHPREALLRHKALMVWHEEKMPSTLNSPNIMTHLMRRYRKMKPVYNWIDNL